MNMKQSMITGLAALVLGSSPSYAQEPQQKPVPEVVTLKCLPDPDDGDEYFRLRTKGSMLRYANKQDKLHSAEAQEFLKTAPLDQLRVIGYPKGEHKGMRSLCYVVQPAAAAPEAVAEAPAAETLAAPVQDRSTILTVEDVQYPTEDKTITVYRSPDGAEVEVTDTNREEISQKLIADVFQYVRLATKDGRNAETEKLLAHYGTPERQKQFVVVYNPNSISLFRDANGNRQFDSDEEYLRNPMTGDLFFKGALGKKVVPGQKGSTSVKLTETRGYTLAEGETLEDMLRKDQDSKTLNLLDRVGAGYVLFFGQGNNEYGANGDILHGGSISAAVKLPVGYLGVEGMLYGNENKTTTTIAPQAVDGPLAGQLELKGKNNSSLAIIGGGASAFWGYNWPTGSNNVVGLQAHAGFLVDQVRKNIAENSAYYLNGNVVEGTQKSNTEADTKDYGYLLLGVGVPLQFDRLCITPTVYGRTNFQDSFHPGVSIGVGYCSKK